MVNSRSILATATIAVFAACSSGGGVAPLAPQTQGVANGAHRVERGKLVLGIHVPRKKKNRHRGSRYVSSATKGMTIAIVGLTDVAETVGLTPSATGCTSSLAGTFCTLVIPGLAACPSSANCYSATIATYDDVAGCPSACAIPGGAHELSGNQNVVFTVAEGQHNSVNITLEGIPTSVAIVPDSDSTLSGSMASGFSLGKCHSPAQHVSVFGVDADHNYILGAGAPTPSLSTDDATDLPVTGSPPVSSPNRFALTPTTIATTGKVVHLLAKATPLAGSGATAASSQVTVTFGGICGVITEFSAGITAFGAPLAIAAGADGNLWFPEENANVIGRVTTGGTITEFSTGLTANNDPYDIAAGPDGNMWFTENCIAKIGRITTAGTITEFSVGITGNDLRGITAGPDGNLWFVEDNGDTIGQITTAGAITEFSVGMSSNADPQAIAAGSDHNLWFTENGQGIAPKIGRITTAGTISEFSVGLTADAGPSGIAAGPDGNLWFAERNVNKIGMITTAGAITEFSAGLSASSGPLNIIAGRDGNIWFTECLSERIGKITTAGLITEFSTGFTGDPHGIGAGPDGNVWFTELFGSAVSRIQ